MHITRVLATPVRIPRKQVFTSSLGTDHAHENAVVEIETDSGVTGIGEASSIWEGRGRGEARVIDQLLAPRLVGKDPLRVRHLMQQLRALDGATPPALAGIEMALLDLLGRTLDVPVFDLLGGRVRDRVRLSHSLPMGEPRAIADQAEALAAAGYTTLKVKIGQDAVADLATVTAVRQRLGSSFTLRVDANMGWASPAIAIENIRQLEALDLELVEQPLGKDERAGLHAIREQVATPIMADESVWTPADAVACIRANAVDIFNVYVSEAGGLFAASEIFAIGRAAGLRSMIGSMPEFGIGTVAQAHLAFAMEDLDIASDVNGVAYASDDILMESLPIESGYYQHPPAGPGLGVTLDRNKLEKYRLPA
jgi:L-alanine-DL-glutamate epimerase-like enolase superfamily enzyme